MQRLTIIIIVILLLAALGLGVYLLWGGARNPGTANIQNTNQNSMNSFQIQGMQVEILAQGQGEAAKDGDNVTVNYVGIFENGEKFDSSYDRNGPFSFPLGQSRVIKGWDLGVVGMKVGEKRKLTVPPELAYGSTGFLSIPPNATLTFEVELLKIN